jgi:hypothetical protein
LTPFLPTFSCGSGITASTFLADVTFTPGAHPTSIVTGDIDGDGKPDLVTSNANDNTVSVLLNTSTSGTVSFAAKVDFAVGTYPWAVTVGDLDGDGKLDIAASNGTSNSISVLRNLSTPGSVSFAAKTDYTCGTSPYSIQIGDLDSDGKPEVVTANYATPGKLSVYKNMSTVGSISLAAKADFTVGGHPKSVAICDIDGDTKPDLISADYNTASNTASVLRNTSSGSISFATKVSFLLGANPYFVVTGDIDGDGKPDLVIPNSGDDTFSVLRNTSTSGTVNFATKVNFATGSNPTSSSVEDLDGDGKLDVVISDQYANLVSVYKNLSTSGSVAFSSKVDFSTYGTPYWSIVCDMDGDQRPDIVTTGVAANLVSVHRNTSCPLGIEDNNVSSIVAEVFPNPFSEKITLSITGYKGEDYRLSVFNALGMELSQIPVTTEKTDISAAGLSPGLYFVRITSGDQVVFNQKIILQR